MTEEQPRGWVSLKPRREITVSRGHPWIFSGAIAKTSDGLATGAIVEVRTASGARIGSGLYAGAGSIAVKVFGFGAEELDAELIRRRLRRAVELRRALGLLSNPETNGCRLVHGEGDGLPGVVIDWYAGAAVIQLHLEGIAPFLPVISDTLAEVQATDSLHTICVHQLGNEGESERSLLVGDQTAGVIREGGIQYSVDWMRGQKTGFFLDQRDARRVVRERTPRRASCLNLFSYTGGFTMALLKGGAERVLSVDSSPLALELLDKTAALNGYGLGHAPTVCSDVFRFLGEDRERYSMVVADPPAFAKHQKSLERGIRGYERLAELAVDRVAPGGMLAVFSCSQAVSRERLWQALQVGVGRARRSAQVIGSFSQASCHPVALAHPEGEYLKGFLLMIAG